MSSYLPEDAVVRILSCLPPKSLIRFRSVSKAWLFLIGNPDFFSKNLLNQSILTQNPTSPLPLILVKATNKSNPGKQIYSFLSYGNLDIVSQVPLNLPESSDRRFLSSTQGVYNDLKIVAFCNGLLCLHHHYVGTRDIYLWNPSAPSGLNVLPSVSHHGQPELTVLTYGVGFGFDPRSNDFKVVRLLAFLSTTASFLMDTHYGAEVYSMRDGSWRLLDLLMPVNIYSDSPTVALGGLFLWYLGFHYDEATDEDESIFAFDFSDEVFRKTRFPDASVFRDYGQCARTLTGLKGSIAMLVFPRAPSNTNFCLDLWVLLEFGIKESWTRLISIGPLLDVERPLGFWNNGQLFLENSEGQLVLYDPYTEIKKNLQIEGVKGSLEVALYMQSPVAINGAVEIKGQDNL
ncbi:hypothetical protein I3843_14G021300 [Carya illinoinensis]|uniref:F-box domain-containing protein n=1 Tax=Carya illinoinensis TaxID=32201 RepID=A0A922D8Y0_CARIL|nr:hypothetical protein I3842_14G022000 [Carya illinoinensis]KAG7946100.1 hypothetical protein I3843_14G021300 [Carya illinoinensis]